MLQPVLPVAARSAPEQEPPFAEVLLDLYRRQLETDRDPYLIQHAAERVVRHHVRIFRWYRGHLPAGGDVLEWGCYHGPDAVFMRTQFGDSLNIEACDFVDEDRFPVFRQFTGVRYARLRDAVKLPYPDAAFDVVIASGVLEHVAMDHESLKEAYRVLRPDGKLVISYLPNRLSWGEWYMREWKRQGEHRRLYGRGEFDRLLRHFGFVPLGGVRYQSFLWEKRLEKIIPSERAVRAMSGVLRTLFPVHRFCSTLCCVAQKVTFM